MLNPAREERPRLSAIDLFSGAGGLTTGLKQAGFQVLAAIEVDPTAAETFSLNHPKVKVYTTDVRTLSGSTLLDELKLKPGDLSLLAGCPPCQGFSRLRTRNGNNQVTDHRNDLLFEFVRLARILAPKAIMMENVPALVKDSRFQTFLDEMDELGYPTKGAYKVLNAADFGVPQRRLRLVVLLAKGKSVDFLNSNLPRRTVRDAIGKISPPGSTGDLLHENYKVFKPHVQRIISAIPKDGGSRSELPAELRLACHQRTDGFRDVYGRMEWMDVSPTITSGCCNPSKGRFLHPEEDRVITLREAALLQGFPFNYRFSFRRGTENIALQIGNALPPPFIKHHATQIIRSFARS